MIFIAGLSPRIKQLGVASGSCPACGIGSKLHVVRKSQCISLFFIPLIPLGGQYIVTCAACASVMALRKQAGENFRRNPDSPLSPYDLETMQNHYRPLCRQCGQLLEQQYAFCPGCGLRV